MVRSWKTEKIHHTKWTCDVASIAIFHRKIYPYEHGNKRIQKTDGGFEKDRTGREKMTLETWPTEVKQAAKYGLFTVNKNIHIHSYIPVEFRILSCC